MEERTSDGKGNKYETLGSSLIQQIDEIGSFIVARKLDYGSKRLRSFDTRWYTQILKGVFF